jgi:hypothetical protein
MHPWNLKIDKVASPSESITQIISRLLTMNHPNGTIENILTFMWCLWKARNDCLFNKKDSTPLQVHYMTNAIKQNLELLDPLQVGVQEPQTRTGAQQELTNPGSTISSDLRIQGSKIFSDATWRKINTPGAQENPKTGLGVYCQFTRECREETVMIQASTIQPSSPILAEAAALLLASNIAAKIQEQGVTFLTDNLTLARAAAAHSIADKQVPWELRQQIADYKKASEHLIPKIYHRSHYTTASCFSIRKQTVFYAQSEKYSCTTQTLNEK